MSTDAVDHVAAALARLPSRWRDKPNLAALVTLLATAVQDVEDALQDARTLRRIATGTDAQLDTIGEIVGQERGGASDADYRRYLYARIASNRSHGTVEDLLRVSRLVLNDATLSIEVQPYAPASLVIRITGAVTDAVAAILIVFLRVAKAAGVALQLVTSTAAATSTFRFARAGYGTTITAFQPQIDLGYVSQNSVNYREAHPSVASGPGYAWIRGAEADGTSHSEVAIYDALNRGRTPDRYEMFAVGVANQYDYSTRSPGSGFAQPPAVIPLAFSATTFGSVVDSCYVIPAGTFRVYDDDGNDETIAVPAGRYSMTMLVDLINAQSPDGFDFVGRPLDNEIDLDYTGAGTEFSMTDFSSAAFQTALGLDDVVAQSAPALIAAIGQVASGTGGVWASARA